MKVEIIKKPITGYEYELSIWDDIEEYEDYDELFKTIERITDKDHVTLKVSSPGGRCDIGFTIYDKIIKIPCKVDVIVPYPAYSMGAILALSGNSLKINPGAYIMFHDYSTGNRGKGNEIKKNTEAYQEVFEYRFNEVCQPFLTKKECKDILNGQDRYVMWNETDLKARMGRHFK